MPLYSKLAASASAHPADVTMVKGALTRLGFYQAPDWGIDEFPDRALFDAIQAFQKASGLKADGVIDPGGKTEEMLLGPAEPSGRDDVRNLPYIIPREPAPDVTRPLPDIVPNDPGREDGKTLFPITDMTKKPEFTTWPDTIPVEPGLPGEDDGIGRMGRGGEYRNLSVVDTDKEEKKGEYIWRTQGDGKVRESHAARDGEVFSWDSPPDGGHPGEAPNCRCWAEDVEDNEAECKALQHKIENQEIAVQEALKAWEGLQKQYETAEDEYNRLRRECDKERMGSAVQGGLGGIAGAPGRVWGVIRGVGEGALPDLTDSYSVCTEADEKEAKVNELKERKDSALTYLQEQQAILGQLRQELAERGCAS